MIVNIPTSKMTTQIITWILILAIHPGLTGNPNAEKPQLNIRENHMAIVIRDIGHQLLLQLGDSTSRILPVRKLQNHTFKLEFQRSFYFRPDTLVSIVRQKLGHYDLGNLYYQVHVFDCHSDLPVYGFEVNAFIRDIVPCHGRVQPSGCYYLQIAFLENEYKSQISPGNILLALAVVFIFTGIFKIWKKTDNKKASNYVSLGSLKFDEQEKILKNTLETIKLSDKEAKLLGLLASHPNHLVERNFLITEIWESEGIITGRSLGGC